MVYARAYFQGAVIAEVTDIGFSNVDEVMQRLVPKFPSTIPMRSEVTFRIKDVDTDKEGIYVRTKGKGYELFVQAGDHVQKGQLLFRFDLQAIAAAGYTLTTPVIVTNSSRFARIEPLLSGRVTAGQQLLRAKM